MNKLIAGALVLVAILFVGKPAVFGYAFAAIAPPSWVSDRDFLGYAAKTFNESGPVRLDENLVATRVDASDTGIVFNYQVTAYTRERLAQTDFARIVRDELVARACAGELVREILARDLHVEYAYFDSRDEEITRVVFTRGDCA